MDEAHWLQSLWYVLVPLIFIGIVVWVFRPSARGKYRAAKRQPFKEGDEGQDRSPR